MCMVDGGDGYVVMLGEYDPVANKEHTCDECRRAIFPGEKYHRENTVWEGKHATYKTCRHCMRARAWLTKECGGFLYQGVEEDIREHADSGDYGVGVKMLAIGMERNWKRKDGRMWRVPSVPKSTHELERMK